MTISNEEKNRQTLTEAHRDYEKSLRSHVFFKIRDIQTGEDLIQDTFMKTWMYLVRGGEIEKMKAFLYHILNNLIIDEYRKHKTVSLDVLIDKGFDPSVNTIEPLVDFLDGKRAIRLIKNLSPRYQEVVHMRYIQMLSIKEISLITRQSKNTVAVQTHRGLTQLKLLYENTH